MDNLNSEINLFQVTLNIVNDSSDTIDYSLVTEVIVQLLTRISKRLASSVSMEQLVQITSSLDRIINIYRDKNIECAVSNDSVKSIIGDIVTEFYSKLLQFQHNLPFGFCIPYEQLAPLCDVFILCLDLCPHSIQKNTIHIFETSILHYIHEKPTAYGKYQTTCTVIDVRIVIETLKRILRKASVVNFELLIIEEIVHCLYPVFIEALKVFDDTLVGQISCTLLKDMIRSCDDNYSQTVALWAVIVDIVKETETCSNEVFNCKPLTILCSLADVWFPVKHNIPSNKFLDLRCDPLFWNLLQQGFTQNNSLARKQSIYLLKRIVDICNQTQEKLKCYLSESHQVPLFWWENEYSHQLTKLWDDFIILFEIFEEKQVHIIKPLLHRFSNLVEATTDKGGSLLHSSWLLVLISRCLLHENIFLIKWAVKIALDFNFVTCPFILQGQESYFSGKFLGSLKEIKLYGREPDTNFGSCPKIGDSMVHFFLSCWEALETKERRANFFCTVLNTMNSQSWGPIPLVFLSRALTKLPQSFLLNKTAIVNIREIVVTCQRTVETYIRGATQCFLAEALINLLDFALVTPSEWAYCVSVFYRDESLQRSNSLWKCYVKWLQNNITNDAYGTWATKPFIQALYEAFLNYLKDDTLSVIDGTEAIKIVRTFLLCCDAGILLTSKTSMSIHDQEPPEHLSADDFLLPLIDILLSLNTHAYLPVGKAHRALHLLLLLLDEFGTAELQKEENDSVSKSVFHIVTKCASETVKYISYQITYEIECLDHTELLHIYCRLILKYVEWNLWDHIIEDISLLISTCIELLKETSKPPSDVSISSQILQAIAMSLLGTITKMLYLNKLCSSHKIQSMLKDFSKDFDSNYLNLTKPSSLEYGNSMKDVDKNQVLKYAWGKLSSLYSINRWWCMLYFSQIQITSISSLNESEKLLQQTMDALCLGSGDSALPMLKCLENDIAQVASELTNCEIIVNAMNIAWNRIEEEHKSAAYWQLFEAYVTSCFQTETIRYPANSTVNKFLQENSILILQIGEERTGMANIFIKRLCKVFQSSGMIQYAENFTRTIINACTYGTVYRKNERFRQDVSAFIGSIQDECAINELQSNISKSDIEVRMLTINWLTHLDVCNSKHCSLVHSLIIALIEKHREINQCRSYRNFANSLPHRLKQRIVQVLVLFKQFIIESNQEFVWDYIWETLMVECQPSVRNMLEWLALCLILKFPPYISQIWQQYKMLAETSSMCTCSLLKILSHIGPWLESELEQTKFYESAFLHLLSLCMNHHFNTRIYARATSCKMWKQCKSLQLNHIISKFSLLEGCLQFNDDSNATKNTIKLMESYFMAVFNPIRDFSIETIFHLLPKLTGLNDEEWILPQMFNQTDSAWSDPTASKSRLLPLYNEDKALSHCKSEPWKVKISHAPVLQNEESSTEGLDFQKKIMPWRLMTPDVLNEEQQDFLEKKTNVSQLVLVTSLINKVPNLGGLCRTAEVFGITEFVIGSLRHLADKNFQSLSVTAEKWISMKEVPVDQLQNFLFEKQREGFTLVGAEQTANSVSLQHYQMAKKTVLILGNEREGIPTNLIPLLDVCVEIPQQGIVRSLNVHVSGAILMWEYTRQLYSSGIIN